MIIETKKKKKVIELKLTNDEKMNFKKSVESVKELFNAARKIDKDLN